MKLASVRLRQILRGVGRSRVRPKETGDALEKALTVLPLVALIGGAFWTLHDYFEFKQENDRLTLQQQTASLKLGEFTLRSQELANRLSEFKLKNVSQGRLDSTTEANVYEIKSFDDGTRLYRFDFSFRTKNISEIPVHIPVFLIEFYIGDTPEAMLEPGQAFKINDPPSFKAKAEPATTEPAKGPVNWQRLVRSVYTEDVTSDLWSELSQDLPKPGDGGLTGELRPGQSDSYGVSYVARARPDQAAGAVVTLWITDENGRDQSSGWEWRLLADAEKSPATQNGGKPAKPAVTER